MATTNIPIRYVGLARHTTDHLYGSGVRFTKGRVSQVPDWAAAKLLRHPEFEDARPKDQAGKPILATRKPDRADVDREREEIQALEAHVNLDTMTRDQMSSFAMRTYGVIIDPAGLKVDVAGKVRTLMRQHAP